MAPPFELNEDVLWKILTINANMNNDEPGRRYNSTEKAQGWRTRALVMTWTCSHVCRRWRESIVHSPTLWARLIDLDVLVTVRREWRDEILRRTGESVLLIKGDVFASRPLEWNLVMTLLQDLWHRIQRLDIRVLKIKNNPNDGFWDFLYRPAPALQVFRFRTHSDQTAPLPTPARLFANDAPLLQDFRVSRLPLKLTPEMTWLHQVRRLDVYLVTSRRVMSVYDWLRMLEQMPLIESLALYSAFQIPPNFNSSTTTKLHRPHLAEIRLTDYLMPCTEVLAKIIPRPGCSLSLSALDSNDGPPQDLDLTSVGKVVSRYAQTYFNDRPITTLFLAIYPGGFAVEEDHRCDNHASDTYFRVDIQRMNDDGQHPPMLQLLDAFSSCSFEYVTTLEFEVIITPFQALDSNVHRFLASLPNVVTLLTFGEALWALQTLDDAMLGVKHDNTSHHDRSPFLFPSLRVVKLKSRDHNFRPRSTEGAIPFLTSRHASQRPVEVLDLTRMDWKGFRMLDIFADITGLKVIYHDGECIRERICGSHSDEVQGI
ncbi:hypothetical protein GALMADRAFT_256725 [Galerina marginata CBS 339.88]|uniref:F-box domain-containing protein n=1 Tax=Galerina marginata (strain CBS 339.88) TaxID=685588 RepID=A0A067SP27_GALM3|nr:hypothetical protein GALMADRAFT_256725 [Galerina marginata CBS 339.88]